MQEVQNDRYFYCIVFILLYAVYIYTVLLLLLLNSVAHILVIHYILYYIHIFLSIYLF